MRMSAETIIAAIVMSVFVDAIVRVVIAYISDE